MSDKSGGFFSSVGRFFSGGSASKSNSAEKSSPTTRDDGNASPSTAAPAALLKDIISNDDASAESSEVPVTNYRVASRLRYLSPSALDQRSSSPSSGLEIDVNPESDIFFNTPSVSTNRKRQLTELDRQALPQTFRSDTVKRSRFLNRSLLEPTVRGTISNDKRLDMSWCGELTANHSPASSITDFSLMSRRSGATTNGSLSSRTQEIFKRLDGASTPAKEVQRMSMIRAGLVRNERWASNESQSADPASTATPPPPLKKAGDGIPSRIQLISKTMGSSSRRPSPYWTDLTRKRTNGENGSTDSSSLKSLNGTLASTELSSIFSLEPPAPKKTSSSASTASTTTMHSSDSRKHHVAILKGPDGKSVSRNTFKLSDDGDEEDTHQLPPLPAATLSNPQPLKLAPESNLERGFLNNLAFSFTAPCDLVSAVGKANSVGSSIRSSESKEPDSDSNGEASEKRSAENSGVESDSGESDAEEVKDSRPQTSADTISSADRSNSSDQSSKESPPKTAVESAVVPVSITPSVASSAKWTCQECFTSWEESKTACGACTTPRPGTGAPPPNPSDRQLVSNLKSFESKQPSTVKFGFGSGPSTTPFAAIPSTSASVPFGKPVTAAPSLFAAKPAAPVAPVAPVSAPVPPVTAPAPTAGPARVNWDCPDCMVSNKATDDKCPCCGHVKYASAESASMNVFGNRAFKASTTGVAAVQFGVTAGSKAPAFGFGAPKPSQEAAPAPAPAVAPAPAPAFGFSSTSSAPPVTEAVKPTGSLFGNKPTISATSSLAPPAPTTQPSLFGSNSLFGASKPDSSATKPNIFGSQPAKEAPTTTTTSAPVAPAAPAPLFGATSGSSNPFGGAPSLFGSSKPAEAPKPLSFGTPAVTTATSSEAPKTNIFGNLGSSSSIAPAPAPTTTTSLFGSGSTASTNLFAAKPSETSSIFGKPIQFSGDVGTTTTDGVPAKRPVFSSDAPKLTFGGAGGGGEKKPEAPKFGNFGGSTPAPTTTGSLFGGTSSMFGGPSSTATPAFGTTSTVPFGTAAPANPGFGAFGKPTQPGMSTSSSTNSLFGQTDPSNPFGSTNNNNGFNFGSTSNSSSASTGAGVFQFGGAPAAPPAIAPTTSFQFGNNLPAPAAPAPGTMDNAFSYQAPSGGARKMAMARRRNIRK